MQGLRLGRSESREKIARLSLTHRSGGGLCYRPRELRAWEPRPYGWSLELRACRPRPYGYVIHRRQARTTASHIKGGCSSCVLPVAHRSGGGMCPKTPIFLSLFRFDLDGFDLLVYKEHDALIDTICFAPPQTGVQKISVDIPW